MARSNIILLTFDALRYDFLGHGGGPADTPTLDRLADRHRSFKEAYATASWTAPSFKSMFTGQYPLENNGRIKLNKDDTSVIEQLNQAGYQTLGFPHHPYLCRLYGFDQGFDIFKDGIDFGNSSWTEQLKRYLLESDIGNYLRLAKSIYSRHSCTKLGTIIDELFEQDLDEPFFAWMHSLDTHTPFTPPKEYTDISRRRSLQVHRARHDYRQGNMTKDEFEPYLEDLKQLYIDEIEYIDAQVKRLIEQLKEQDRYEDTVLIITADHGEEFLEHGNLHHQKFIYEELTHVPLIIKGSRTDDATIEEIASLIQIGPTLLDVAGSDAYGRCDPADSLLTAPPGEAYMHAAEGDVLSGADPKPYLTGDEKIGLRTEHWHYIENEHRDDELFDLRSDRREQTNLIDEQTVPEQLTKQLTAHRQMIETAILLEDVDV